VTLSGVSAGNMIVVIWGSDTAANFVSCSDPTNGTYSRVGPTSWRQGTNVRAGIVYKANVAAGSPTITCTFSAGSRIAMAVAELSGIDPTNPVDLGSVSNTGGASTAISCGTTTTSNSSDEYSVAAAVNGSAATFSNPASGYTMQATASATGSPAALFLSGEFTGFRTFAPTVNKSNTDNWACFQASFRAAQTATVNATANLFTTSANLIDDPSIGDTAWTNPSNAAASDDIRSIVAGNDTST
jgi:hypothetical protein